VAGRRAWAGHLPGEGGGPDRWGPPVCVGKEVEVVPIRDLPRVGREPDWQLGRMAPRWPFILFIFVFSFSLF
jgi:hypothetical protein